MVKTDAAATYSVSDFCRSANFSCGTADTFSRPAIPNLLQLSFIKAVKIFREHCLF